MEGGRQKFQVAREREGEFENDGLKFSFPPLGGVSDHGEAWQIIQTGNELCSRGGRSCIRLLGVSVARGRCQMLSGCPVLMLYCFTV
jgi:hypothetical protein